jgi:hypothetical protein
MPAQEYKNFLVKHPNVKILESLQPASTLSTIIPKPKSPIVKPKPPKRSVLILSKMKRQQQRPSQPIKRLVAVKKRAKPQQQRPVRPIKKHKPPPHPRKRRL